MPTILTKKSDTPGAIPATANLTNAAGGAELAVNTADKRLFTITSGSQVVELGTNPASLTCADVSATVLRAGSATITNLIATTATVSDLSATVARISSLTISSLSLSNATFGSATITNLTSTSATISSALTLTGGTANGVLYLNGSKVATSGSALTFDGTDLATTGGFSTGNGQNISLNASSSGQTDRLQWKYQGTAYAWIERINSNGDMAFGVQSSERMRLDGSGNLGIGTSSPSTKLDVNGAINIGANTWNKIGSVNWFYYASGTGVNNLAAGSGGLVFRNQADSADLMRLDTSGNLGLGVTPSAWSVGKAIEVAAVGNAIWGNGAGNIRVLSNSYYDGAFKYATSSSASQYAQDAGTHAWSIAASGTAGNTITFTQAMTLDTSGNLALGTTSALGGIANRASIVSASSGGSALALQNTSASGYSSAEFYNNSGTQTGAVGYANASASVTAGNVYMYSTGALTFLAGGTTERARITSGGDFGIGTASPSTKLEVAGNVKITGTNLSIVPSTGTNAAYLVNTNTSGNLFCAIDSSTGSAFGAGNYARVLYSSGAYPLAFFTNDAERARITSGGYFKASDAGTYVGSTGTYHELRNTANETAALFSCSNTGFTSSVMSSTAYPVSGTGFKHLICRSDNGNDEVMNIRGDGNLYNDNGVYGSISDQRFKQDIEDAPSQWSDIKAVRFRKFRMKDDVARNENAPYLLGVVAQELEQVSPGLVDDGEVKTVKSSILLMKAAVALQEAMARIEKLEAEVAALKGA